jgi:hypothetical protein
MQLRQSSAAVWPVLGAAMLGAALWSTSTYLSGPEAPLALAPPFFLSGPAPLKCPRCGWIEDKREIVPEAMDASAPKTYEYTLRMADGSVSLFRETMPTKWQLGERMTLIDGISPLD